MRGCVWINKWPSFLIMCFCTCPNSVKKKPKEPISSFWTTESTWFLWHLNGISRCCSVKAMLLKNAVKVVRPWDSANPIYLSEQVNWHHLSKWSFFKIQLILLYLVFSTLSKNRLSILISYVPTCCSVKIVGKMKKRVLPITNFGSMFQQITK